MLGHRPPRMNATFVPILIANRNASIACFPTCWFLLSGQRTKVHVGQDRSNPFSVEQCRRFYSEEIRVTAPVTSAALVSAFARIPREQFLGPPPWQLCSGVSLQAGTYRSTTDVRDLYHDALVLLKREQRLNTGQPSVVARLLEALGLSTGMRVIHVGCGTGYYSAIMAEVIGATGTVIAFEIEPDLAALAAVNLKTFANIKVLHKDAATVDPGPANAILVNAGVTHLHPAWLSSLTPGGVLVTPFLVGRSLASRDALAVRIVRRGTEFAASLVTVLSIYPSPTMRNPALQSLLNASFESEALLNLRSLRLDPHASADTCIVHTPAFCLSARPVAATE